MIWWIIGVGGGVAFIVALFDVFCRKHSINSGHAILMIGGLVAIYCAFNKLNLTEVAGVKFAQHYAKEAREAAAKSDKNARLVADYTAKLLSSWPDEMPAEKRKEMWKTVLGNSGETEPVKIKSPKDAQGNGKDGQVN